MERETVAEMPVAYQKGRMEKNPAEFWYEGALGFFDNYIISLAKKLKDCGVSGVSSDEYLNYALENRRQLANQGEEMLRNLTGKYQPEPTEPVNPAESKPIRNLSPKTVPETPMPSLPPALRKGSLS